MVEGNGLENRRAGNGTVGSNPTLSAIRLVSLAHGHGDFGALRVEWRNDQIQSTKFKIILNTSMMKLLKQVWLTSYSLGV